MKAEIAGVKPNSFYRSQTIVATDRNTNDRIYATTLQNRPRETNFAPVFEILDQHFIDFGCWGFSLAL